MSLFSFFNFKEKDLSIERSNTDNVVNLGLVNLKEHERSVKDLINGFYTIGASFSTFKLSIEIFQKSIFSESEHLSTIFSLLIENTNNASDKITNIFSDLEADNEEKLKKISSVILRIQESLEAINKFLGATNMVSLNAKLEAARAREYGKGFSVVADEIKRLSDQAKGVMSVILVREIEEVSKDLISKNLDDLKNDISNFFKSILKELNDLQGIFSKFLSFKGEFDNVLSTLEGIENNIVSLTGTGGHLLESKAFMITNDEFVERIDAAISAHIIWEDKLKSMVQEKKVISIQTDGTKCGFGLFYNSVVPKNLGIKKTWLEIKQPHLDLHKTAVNIIYIFEKKSIEEHDLMQSRELLKNAEHFSHEVVGKLEAIKEMVLELNKKNINVFY